MVRFAIVNVQSLLIGDNGKSSNFAILGEMVFTWLPVSNNAFRG